MEFPVSFSKPSTSPEMQQVQPTCCSSWEQNWWYCREVSFTTVLRILFHGIPCIFFQALQINWDRCSRLLCTSKWRELARKSRYASQKKHVEFCHVGKKLTHPSSACPLPSLLLRHSTSLSLSPSPLPLWSPWSSFSSSSSQCLEVFSIAIVISFL